MSRGVNLNRRKRVNNSKAICLTTINILSLHIHDDLVSMNDFILLGSRVDGDWNVTSIKQRSALAIKRIEEKMQTTKRKDIMLST